MAERQQFEMTAADLAEMMEKISAARKTSGMLLSGGIPMSNPQEAANGAWQALGAKMGFDGMSVRPVPGAGDRVFTAIPTTNQEEQKEQDTLDKITLWKAKRSGAGMTIRGKDEAGVEVKLVDIVLITQGDTDPGTGMKPVIATDDRGQEWQLV